MSTIGRVRIISSQLTTFHCKISSINSFNVKLDSAPYIVLKKKALFKKIAVICRIFHYCCYDGRNYLRRR